MIKLPRLFTRQPPAQPVEERPLSADPFDQCTKQERRIHAAAQHWLFFRTWRLGRAIQAARDEAYRQHLAHLASCPRPAQASWFEKRGQR